MFQLTTNIPVNLISVNCSKCEKIFWTVGTTSDIYTFIHQIHIGKKTEKQAEEKLN